MAGNPTAPSHEIITIPSYGEGGRDLLKEQCFAVRIAVFSDEQGFPLDTEIDDADETAMHILLRLTPSLEPIGTIRGHKPPGKSYYKLSRLAVLKDYRQHRFGCALVLALHDWVTRDARRASAELGLNGASVEVVCHSQIPVKAFYAKFGYVPEGNEFDEDGAPHQKMVARLPLQFSS
ncbi:acyl-CoA N-acyltransferase [Rickenella mellea]|uniref:Acyl-CoA N-acyltransferase n=1 Tax=Rickenella mellea TaxID=50990 RepID=A0A4R5XFA3_9AGAM|nr:acyl-CoA N-acyltransferase [Rickenella mellea]